MISNSDTPVIRIDHLDQLWFQVAGTRCNLECNHCFISCSPKNKSFGFLTLEFVEGHLQQAGELGVKEFYFTGGEPFLNPEMVDILITTLALGPATVLTNATVLQDDWLTRLSIAASASRYSLEFRVSIDGFDAETNDPIRGVGTFDRAIRGVQKLVKHGFLPIITAVQTWSDEDNLNVIQQFTKTLKSIGYDRPRIKILPTLQMGAEENRTHGYTQADRLTNDMMVGFDHSQLICHNSRIVTDRGVHVCPILIETPDSLLSDNIADSLVPFEMSHGACVTCYRYGAICSNPSNQFKETHIQKSNETV